MLQWEVGQSKINWNLHRILLEVCKLSVDLSSSFDRADKKVSNHIMPKYFLSCNLLCNPFSYICHHNSSIRRETNIFSESFFEFLRIYRKKNIFSQTFSTEYLAMSVVDTTEEASTLTKLSFPSAINFSLAPPLVVSAYSYGLWIINWKNNFWITFDWCIFTYIQSHIIENRVKVIGWVSIDQKYKTHVRASDWRCVWKIAK